jgi:DNA repair protein RadC
LRPLEIFSVSRHQVARIKVPGVGEVKAAQIHAAIEIGACLDRRKAAANKFADASRTAELVGPEMRLLPAESARVVLTHNHPSGDPSSSEADIRITRSLKEASKVLDIPLLDHVIIGSPSTAYPEGWFSFKAAGYL